MKKIQKNNKGFTLVELIVVIAILGVLAAVLVPQYIQYVEKSRVAADKNTVATIEQAINVLCADGTIKSAGTFTWDKETGAVTSSTDVSISSLQAILNSGAVSESGTSYSTIVKKGTSSVSEDVTFTVTITNGVPHVAVSPDYTAWTA